MNNMPANRNTHTFQKQGSISMCFGYIRATTADVFTDTSFLFLMDLLAMFLILKLPKEPPKNMKFGEFFVDKQGFFIS